MTLYYAQMQQKAQNHEL